MSQQYSWGSRVTPISTANTTAPRSSNTTSSNSPSRNTFSPVGSGQPPLPSSSRQSLSRATSVSSTSSPFSPSQGVQQQTGNQLLFSSRSNRTIPSSSSSQLPSSTAAGEGSGGGGPRLVTRPSPSLSQSSDIASPSNNITSTPFSADSKGSASIDIAQVSILLARIDKEKDTAKRGQLTKELIEVVSHGMEVFVYTFRKLLRQHASRIFGPDAVAEPAGSAAGSYNLLVSEVKKIRQDPEQSKKIADALDTSEGEPFRDFDVSTFMDRFKLDAVSKSMLALALKNTSRADLKTKSDAILSANLELLLMTILTPATETGDDLPTSYLTSLLDRLLQNPPRNWNEETHSNLNFAIRNRYEKMAQPVPSEVLSTLQLAELMGPSNNLVRLVQRTGERATSSIEACNEMLRSAETRDINYTQVASVLLFMVITQNGQAYNPAVFVAALRDHRAGKRLDWQDVVHAFDREGLTISKQQFLALYNALLPLAQEYENFDIQLLWGGAWSQPDTQLSFVVAYLSCTSEELDASEVPRLRKAFTLEEFEDAPEDVKEYAKEAVRHPLVSLDATQALFSMIFQNQDTYKHAITLGIPETVINPHTDFFVVATAAVPQPWGGLQDQAFKQLFMPFLQKRLLTGANFVFHGLWKRDSNWLATKLIEAYTIDPTNLTFIYEQAEEHGWLVPLTGIHNEFGVDLAALAHSHGTFDLETWLQGAYEVIPQIFPGALGNFIEDKARTDLQSQKDPTIPLPSIPLAVGTVYAFLTFLQQHLAEEPLTRLHRVCMQAYPRLINYGEGFDEIIDENSKDGNATSPQADTAMQEHFKKLYNRESDVRELVEALRKYKNSEDPGEQELFACMIAGLFDEYNCFAEYPPDALATTAVLFGSIINFNLLSSIALQAGLSMVLEALQTASSKDDKMFKFGLQALMNFQTRLSEWPSFCERLLGLPDLASTEIFALADDVVRRKIAADLNGETTNSLTNGNAEDAAALQASSPFHSLAIDPPLRPELYADPDEDVQDRVVFAVNNLSERNITEKFEDLRDAVKDEYHQWFAAHLVEGRAKSQPNYHKLFLDLLQLFNDTWLWEEVIRETIVSVVRMLNADATMNSSTERAHLKNLGGWLGSLTLARDKPIRHRNIAFVDLLIEAKKTKRLIVIIPFTCKVLAAAKDSKTFSPANPWIMDLVAILVEFYFHVDMKINLKFEIEVVCKHLDLDMKLIEPSSVIRESEFTPPYDEPFAPGMGEQALEGFTDLSLARINNQSMLRNGLGERSFSPRAVANSLPDISNRLYYPTTSNNQVTAEQARQVFLQAAQHAIQEIIFPVVERSVTIAGISASQLVTKDFATEPDTERFRNAAHSMVKSLAGSLALVTCREPLRMSMSNNVRALARSLPGEGLPEGIILMFVNDNIDTVCKVIEEAAEKQSIAVVEDAIQDGIQMRQMHQLHHPEERFEFPTVHRYANFMPEPFRPSSGPGGLHPEQLAIYENFGPSRPIPTHGTTASQDARQQLPDLPAFDSSLPNIATPAEAPAVPRQGPQPQRLHAMGLQSAVGHVNGYNEPAAIEEMIAELFQLAQAAPEENPKDLTPTSVVRETYGRLLQEIDSLNGPIRDKVAEAAAQEAMRIVYTQAQNRLEIEIMVQLLSDLTVLSVAAAQRIWSWLHNLEEDLLLRSRISVSLLSRNLLDLGRVDLILSNALLRRLPEALDLLAILLDEVLLVDASVVLRADLARTIEALSQWVADEPKDNIKELLGRLQSSSAVDSALTPPGSKQDHLEHIFEEWVHYVRTEVPNKILVAFVQQLHRDDVLKDSESGAAFLRACLEVSLTAWEQEEQNPYGIYTNALLPIDALAQLIVYLVLHQGEPEGAVKPTKPIFLDSLLSLLALIQCHHFRDRGEDANQKIFYRLYSSILTILEGFGPALADVQDDIMLVFSRLFLALQPRYFPAFAYSWLGLVAHRVFLGATLKMGAQRGGWDAYLVLMEQLLTYTGEMMQARELLRPEVTFFRAVERTLLVIHHDFQDFISENHVRLVSHIPANCPQLRNIITSAFPSAMVELPDPYNVRWNEVSLVENIFNNPVVRGDFATPLEKARIREIVDELLRSASSKEQHQADINFIIDAVSDKDDNGMLIQYLCVYVATQAIATATTKGTPSEMFDNEGVHYNLLLSLTRNTSFRSRYDFIEAMVNQLRFPCSHTYWFHRMLLEMMFPDNDDALALHVKEQIARVLLERLSVERPYSWGLLITTLQLYKCAEYGFFDLPFIKRTYSTWAELPSIQAVQRHQPYLLA